MNLFIWLVIGILFILAGYMGVKKRKFAVSAGDYIPFSLKDIEMLKKKKFRFFQLYHYEGIPAIIFGYFFLIVGISIVIIALINYL